MRIIGKHPGTSDGIIGIGRTRDRRRNSAVAIAFTVVAHLIVFAVLMMPRYYPSQAEPAAMVVSVIALTKPEPPAPPEAPDAEPGAQANAEQPPLPQPAEPAPVPATVTTTLMSDNSDLLSDSQLAGAASAGAGGSGGGVCNMARLVQQALQRDPLVRSAVVDANRVGKAILLWNGDWVQSGTQEGKGLSAVREAVLWEVAFAPEACRNQRMSGLVVLSLADEGTRFGIGAGNWRWSDLLGLRAVPSTR